jgi:hypothetical protein
MEQGFAIVQKTVDGAPDNILCVEWDLGNAEERRMVLEEIMPNDKIVIKEFVGCVISSEEF